MILVGPVLLTTGVAPRIPKLQAVPNGEAEPGTGGTTMGVHTGEVVKVQTKLAASGLPNVSVAPVVIVAVNEALGARGAVGVKVATFVAATYVTLPGTAVPFAVNLNVVVLIVAGFIALLNVAVMTAVLGHTRRVPLGGVTAVTIGGATGSVGLNAAPSGSPHPGVKAATASSNAVIKTLLSFNLFIYISS
jgi:hypothetical protein